MSYYFFQKPERLVQRVNTSSSALSSLAGSMRSSNSSSKMSQSSPQSNETAVYTSSLVTFLEKSGGRTPMVINGKQWVYDISINRYVEYKPQRSEYEVAKKQYNKYMKQLLKLPGFEINYQLNDQVVGQAEKLALLRHTYFEELKYNDDIVSRIHINPHEFNYCQRIANFTRIDHEDSTTTTATAARTATATSLFPTLSIHQSDGDSADEYDDDDIIGDISDIKGVSLLHPGNKTVNMRSLMTNTKLWNDCYEDLKLESITEGATYHDLLPNLKVAMAFQKEYLDYFLNHLHTLKPNLENITDAREYALLEKAQFVFFTEFNLEYLNRLKIEHDRFFKPKKFSSTFQSDYQLMYEKLIKVFINNVDSFYKVHNDHILETWKDFLIFIFQRMLVPNDLIGNNGNTPSMALLHRSKFNNEINSIDLQLSLPKRLKRSVHSKLKIEAESESETKTKFESKTLPLKAVQQNLLQNLLQNLQQDLQPSPCKSMKRNPLILSSTSNESSLISLYKRSGQPLNAGSVSTTDSISFSIQEMDEPSQGKRVGPLAIATTTTTTNTTLDPFYVVDDKELVLRFERYKLARNEDKENEKQLQNQENLDLKKLETKVGKSSNNKSSSFFKKLRGLK